jgi:hypothetical protein
VLGSMMFDLPLPAWSTPGRAAVRRIATRQGTANLASWVALLSTQGAGSTTTLVPPSRTQTLTMPRRHSPTPAMSAARKIAECYQGPSSIRRLFNFAADLAGISFNAYGPALSAKLRLRCTLDLRICLFHHASKDE